MSRNEREIFVWGIAIIAGLVIIANVVIPMVMGVYYAVSAVVSTVMGALHTLLPFVF